MSECRFPPDFIWGVATSSFQVEGGAAEDGRGQSIWDAFCRMPGKVRNGDNGDVACDHYHLYGDDVDAMATLGATSYRFSISWPRVLPEGSGRPNAKGIDYYRRLIDRLHERGIAPNLTMYHWDLPQRLQDRGGWLNRDIVRYFDEYANVLYDNFIGLVPLWSTFNEPRLVYEGYTGPTFAPGLNSPLLGKQVIHNILLSHGSAVRSFRSRRSGNAQIGIVIDIWDNQPARQVKEDIELAAHMNDKFFHVFLQPIFQGTYPKAFLGNDELGGSLDCSDADMDVIHAPLDFLGINCYSRSIVSVDPRLNDVTLRMRQDPESFAALNMEIYPLAIYNACRMIHDRYDADIPLYITENGCPMEHSDAFEKNIHDTIRIRYLEAYLKELRRAILDGIHVKGYYVWSLLDNFEWSFGYSMRCGIMYVDFATQKRTWKDSAFWYQQVIRNNAVQDGLT